MSPCSTAAPRQHINNRGQRLYQYNYEDFLFKFTRKQRKASIDSFSLLSFFAVMCLIKIKTKVVFIVLVHTTTNLF